MLQYSAFVIIYVYMANFARANYIINIYTIHNVQMQKNADTINVNTARISVAR